MALLNRQPRVMVAARTITWPKALLFCVPFVVAVVTFLLRAFRLGQSFDIFIDEITYLQLSKSAITTGAVTLYGKTFYLHPPLHFYLQGAYVSLIQPTGTLIEQIYAARYLNVVFASVSAVMLFLITSRVAGRWAGLTAATLFAFDPFIIQMNSLALLDTPAICWVLIGYAIIFYGLHDRSPQTERVSPLQVPEDTDQMVSLTLSGSANRQHDNFSRWRVVSAGLAFGAAILTKDPMAALTILPLIICVVFRWALPRRTAIAIAVVTCLSYLPYPLTVLLVGDGVRFANQKFMGVQRLLGIVKITGLNRPNGPSLMDRVLLRLGEFGPTYIIISLCVIGLLVVLLSRVAISRLLIAWFASACLLLAYCVAFGTIEEQFFYWMVVSAIPAIVAIGALLIQMAARAAGLRIARAVVVVSFIVLFVGWSGYQWVRIHSTPDNGYERVIAYVRGHLPAEQQVASTSETGQFLLTAIGFSSGPWGRWTDVDALASYHPQYLLLNTQQLTWDQQASAQSIQDWAKQHGVLVFSFRNSRDDALLLYRLTP